MQNQRDNETFAEFSPSSEPIPDWLAKEIKFEVIDDPELPRKFGLHIFEPVCTFLNSSGAKNVQSR